MSWEKQVSLYITGLQYETILGTILTYIWVILT